MSRHSLFALLAMITASVANADPRTDVRAIAQIVEQHFFDAQQASALAEELRKGASAGEFDRYEDRRDLANEITRRLRQRDGHFSVQWRSDRPKRAPTSKAGNALPESRTNYGFTRVERLSGNVAYIELAYAAHIDFAEVKSPSRNAADAALALVRDADALILDVRNNGGGAPSMVGYLVSAFVDPKADVYNAFHSRDGIAREEPAVKYSTPMLSMPLYVLTSGRTGSAAESIAFTLQSAKRAQVVGERSGGAANPGAFFHTPQGYAVFVSTGSPRNPINHRNWEGDGVKPDIEITAERALLRAHELALERVLAGSIAGAARTDAQWSLEALRAAANRQSQRPAADVAGEFGPYTLEATAGTLQAKRARWPAMTLLPLNVDLFYFEGNPSRRLALERKDGKVVAITISNSDGSEQRFRRNETAS